MHGHASIPALTLEAPLAGAFLIGPWVSFSTSAPCFQENQLKDVHGAPVLHEFAGDFLSSPEDKNKYSEPIQTDATWWKGAPVKKFLINWGEYELFRDDDKAFSIKLEEAGLDVTAVECPKEVHVDCILDAMVGTTPGVMTTSIQKWLDTVF